MGCNCDQEFLEARLVKVGGTVKMKMLNKVVEDKLAGREDYRQRLTASPYMSKKARNQLVQGIAVRAMQTCSDWKTLKQALYELQYECLVHARTDQPFHKAVAYLRTKHTTNERVQKAIRKF